MPRDPVPRVFPPLLARARELRRGETPAERLLWMRLRGGQLAGLRFRRQHPIGRYVVDFCCLPAHLIIELDGESHIDQVGYDAMRTTQLEAAGYRVLRVTNQDVRDNLEGVLLCIREACQPGDSPAEPPDRL